MQTAQDVIAHSLLASRALVQRYCEDLKPVEYLHRPCAGANCVAWLLGHLTLSDRRTAQRLGAKDLPALPEGFEQRFARDETAPRASDFGDATALLGIFLANRDALIDTVKKTPAEALERPLEKTHPLFKTAGEMANFMAAHAAMHAGQITIIRRSLGRPPLV